MKIELHQSIYLFINEFIDPLKSNHHSRLGNDKDRVKTRDTIYIRKSQISVTVKKILSIKICWFRVRVTQ
jgi:hypothetical protein